MSIDPIANGYGLFDAGKVSARASSSGDFADLLFRTSRSEPITAATAAEILRLKMLGSALNMGAGEHSAAGRSPDLQRVLECFLEQLPQRGATSGEAGAAEESRAAERGAPASFVGAGGAPYPADASADSIVEKAARRYGVDSALIRAVIRAESAYNPRAVSSAGAQGLMQLMPGTARALGVTDAFDPEQNVMAGTRFLRDLLRRYGGDLDEALAAYNWGPGNVDKHGIDRLPRETRAYLAKVKGFLAEQAGQAGQLVTAAAKS